MWETSGLGHDQDGDGLRGKRCVECASGRVNGLPSSGNLFLFEEEFEFGEKVAAQRVEARDRLVGLVDMPLGVEGENVCATGMKSLVE
jgi:hypothetical protein